MCFICYVQVFFKWQQFISICSFNSYSAFITLKMYIKKVTYITVKICALITFKTQKTVINISEETGISYQNWLVMQSHVSNIGDSIILFKIIRA